MFAGSVAGVQSETMSTVSPSAVEGYIETLDDAIRCFYAISFKTFPMIVSLELADPGPGDQHVRINLSMAARDRKNGKAIIVNSERIIRLGIPAVTFYNQIQLAVKNLVIHEVDECFLVDGKLLNDPHGFNTKVTVNNHDL